MTASRGRKKPDRQKFASQADSEMLAELRRIAEKEGRQFQALIDEAFRDFIEKKTGEAPRPKVMQVFHDSLAEYDSLYQRLAK